jgi:hypothetical protein
MINCAKYIVLWLELYMEVKILHFNFGSLDVATLEPGKNNSELSILEMAN